MKIVIINCFGIDEHRGALIRRYFEDNGHNVVFIASNYSHVNKEYVTTNDKDVVLINSLPYKKNISLRRAYSHIRFAKDVYSEICKLKPDLLWVSVPPNSLIKEVVQYRKQFPNTKLVIDVIDMWPETMPISKFKTLPPFSWWKALRDKYINYADIVVTECDLYQSVLKNVVSPEKLHTLYMAQLGRYRAAKPNPPQDRWGLCYLGSINNIVDINCICKIIKILPKKEKSPLLHIIGDGETREQLIKQAKLTGAEVQYHGKIYDTEQKQQIFDVCHFGLNIMKQSVFVGLTIKSMDYFAGTLPVINNIKGDTWNMVQKLGLGVNFNNATGTFEQDIFADYRQSVEQAFNDKFTEKAFVENMKRITAGLLTQTKSE